MGITTFSRNQNKWGGRSDWSRPSITSTTTTTTTKVMEPEVELKHHQQQQQVVTEKVEKPTVQISAPRFSVFGKKAKFTSINQKSLEQDSQPVVIEEKQAVTSTRKNKFELHLSTKSAANKQQEEQDSQSAPPSPHHYSKKRRQGVKFDSIFLERVCLFREAQSPCELKEAHDKRLLNPPFRIICPSWPPQETSDYYAQKTILLNKKTFFVTPDNSQIKGKLMVRNLALDKSVSIRYTFDCWATVRDVDGVFFGPNPKNIAFDIYEFAMDLGFGQLSDRGELRGKIEFAIRFTAGDKDYWDNNDGRNYQIKVISDPLNDPWANEKKQEKKEKAAAAAAAAANGDKEAVQEEEEEDEYPDDEECQEEEEEEEEEKHNSFTNALKGYKHAKPFHLNKRQPWLGTRYDFGQSLSLAKSKPYESWSATVKADPTLITDYFLVKPITIKPTSPPPNMTPVIAPTPSSSITTSENDTSSLISFSYYPKMTATTSTPTNTTAITNTTTTTDNMTNLSAPSYSKPLYIFSSSSAPPSPRISPTIPSALPPASTRHNLHEKSHSTSAAIPTLTTAAFPLDINSSYYLDLVNKYCFYNSNTSNNDDQQLPISSI